MTRVQTAPLEGIEYVIPTDYKLDDKSIDPIQNHKRK